MAIPPLKKGFTFDSAIKMEKKKRRHFYSLQIGKRLRKEFGEEWQGLIQQLDGNLSLHDVVINGTGKGRSRSLFYGKYL